MILLKCFSPRAVKPLDETAWYCVYKVVRKGITNAINAHLVLFPTSLSFHLIIKDGPDSRVHSAAPLTFQDSHISSFGLKQISELKRVPLPLVLKPNNNHTFSYNQASYFEAAWTDQTKANHVCRKLPKPNWKCTHPPPPPPTPTPLWAVMLPTSRRFLSNEGNL